MAKNPYPALDYHIKDLSQNFQDMIRTHLTGYKNQLCKSIKLIKPFAFSNALCIASLCSGLRLNSQRRGQLEPISRAGQPSGQTESQFEPALAIAAKQALRPWSEPLRRGKPVSQRFLGDWAERLKSWRHFVTDTYRWWRWCAASGGRRWGDVYRPHQPVPVKAFVDEREVLAA